MKQMFLRGKKKQLIIFGILFIMVLVPFNLVGEETVERDDNVFLTPLDSGWNLVSLRYDATLYKENLTVSYGVTDYSWPDAVSAGLVSNFIYKWNAAGQNYSFADNADPSFGYWVFAYEPCQLWGDVNVTVIGIDGGGNPNYLSKFTGSTTIGSSGVYETGSGNIGIGTTTPSTLLDVAGTISANGGSSADWNAAFSWGDHATAGYDTTHDAWSGTADVYTTSGNVGIGTSSPSSLLEVAGLIHSLSGGFKFPDGSIQTTAVTGGTATPWLQKNDAIYYADGDVGIGTTNPTKKVSVWGGDIEVVDENDLGFETINEGDFSTHNNWSVTGDFDSTFTGSDATYSHNAGSGTLSQTMSNLAHVGLGERWYVLEYTVSNVIINGNLSAEITSDFPAISIPLNLTTGSHLEYFRSTGNPTDFKIIVSSDTFGTTFSLDDFTLKEIIGGDIVINGLITGGGNSGIKILSNGNVGIGMESPNSSLEVDGMIESSSGGIKFPDGTIQTTAYLINNSIFKIDESGIDSNVYSTSLKHYAGSGATWGPTAKTWTFTPPSSNSVILGAIIECEGKHSIGGTVGITGQVGIKTTQSYSNTIYSDFDTHSSSTYGLMRIYFSVIGNSRDKNNLDVFPSLGFSSDKISYDFKLRYGVSMQYPTGTAYIKNLKITIYWLDGSNALLTSDSPLID